VYDSILIIVDRYTKLAQYISITKEITAAKLAELFVLYVVKDFGIPLGMTSDRGSVFTSKFWATLCFYLKIRRRLSTAFHPQTDGQTENLNQTLEQYLRCYVNY
jgi:transposase InsO family protein